MDCQKGTFDTHYYETFSDRLPMSCRKATNFRLFKKNPDLVRSGTKVAFSFKRMVWLPEQPTT